jgi:hypothetical protein
MTNTKQFAGKWMTFVRTWLSCGMGNLPKDPAACVAQIRTITGHHIVLGSVLNETRNSLASVPNAVDFVDPEVGAMSQAGLATFI